MKNLTAFVLLMLILIYAGYLRYTGQNWDDYTYSHPDERFLTLNLLPQVGGNNEYTPDEANFPAQKIVVPVEGAVILNLFDLQASERAKIGVVRNSFAHDVAGWLVDASRIVSYDHANAAATGIQSREVDAVIIGEADNLVGSNVTTVGSLSSQDLQSIRCNHLYPDTNGVGGFFDTRCSNLNPHQAGQGFYTYGTFPLFLAHATSDIVRTQYEAGDPLFDWQGGYIVWRNLSMVFDMLTILVVFALATRLHNKWVGLLAAVLYASAPLAIQKSHFGTVNAITTFLVTAALYCAVIVQQNGKYWAYTLFGILCGAAVASRINVAPLAMIIVLAALVKAMPIFDASLSQSERFRIATYHIIGLILAGVGAFLAFRIFNPYAFEGPGFFGIIPNERWLNNISSGSYGVSGNQDSPPNFQWLARPPYIYPLKDMLLWSMGLGFGLLSWFGFTWSVYRLIRNRKGAVASITLIAWISGYFFILMGRIWVMTPRYYLPMYGALAVFAGWSIWELYHQAQRNHQDLLITRLLMGLLGSIFGIIGLYQTINGITDTTAMTSLALSLILLVVAVLPLFNPHRAGILGGIVVLFSVVWGLMFGNVYRNQTTLVQASRYIFEQVPGDFAMKIDDADDTVPLINIPIVNNGYTTSDLNGTLFERATHYTEDIPVRVDFIATADGTISSVFAPHLGDPLDDPDPENIEIRIYADDDTPPIGEAILSSNLTRDTHQLGASYDIPFDEPITVEAGKTYSFEVMTSRGSGDVIGSGSVVLTEGDWDNRVTSTQICKLPDGMTLTDEPASGLVRADDCQGQQPWFQLVNSYDQSMSYPLDNPLKYDDIVSSLEVGDYLTIASNRFYDTEPRNRARWPLTSLYYDKLFAGELGYEVAAVFDETFELGPLRVSDQHLPIYSSPAWLNELEADEAFHVYDHPAVFVFRKTEDYSTAKVEAIFSQVSLLQSHELDNFDSERIDLLGVINWPSIDADQAPTALMLPQDAYETQTNGGTWSERFFSDSFVNTNQVAGVIVWYLTIFIFGVVAFPLVFSLFPKMADGGYGVAKLVGLLLVAWLAWTVSSLKVPLWSQVGVLISLGTLALLSFSMGYRNRAKLNEFIRNNWKRLLWMEVLSIIAFMFMIFVRLTNPDLWHYAKGGEKPMDFAYLNGVLRSTIFPPIDPWFAGGYINYYYFGFVIVSSPALLLGVIPSFAYNLMIPTVFTITGMGAFTSAFNIVSFWRDRPSTAKETDTGKHHLGNPWVAGVFALLLCVVVGNLDTIRVMGNGIAQLGGYTTPVGLDEFLIDDFRTNNNGLDPLPEERFKLVERAAQNNIVDRLRYEVHNSVSLVVGITQGLGRAIQGEVLPIGHDRWYWGPSRVLAETKGVEGNAITEMPYFTFLYGDLHAHMINMPLILLTVLFLFNELAHVGQDHRGIVARFLALSLGAMTVGLMQATNTWDWPSMTLFSIVGLTYVWTIRWKHTFKPIDGWHLYVLSIGIITVIIVIMTVILGQIETNYNVVLVATTLHTLRTALLLAIGLIVLWVAVTGVLVRASAIDLLATVGGFISLSLLFALPYTSWYAATYNSVALWQGGKTPLWAYFDIHGLFLFLVVSLLLWESARWMQTVKVHVLRGRQNTLNSIIIVAVVGGIGTIALGMIGYQVALIVIPLVVWIAILFFRPNQSRSMQFVLVLIGLALSMTLGVEIIVIGGDIGRQNTVFKFYIQAWLLFSVAGGVAVSWLFRASDSWSNKMRMVWYTPFITLFVIAALYPVMATRARALDRMAADIPLTLNGLDYMTASTHYESVQLENRGEVIDLSVDHDLIRWLQENVQGSPVIIEGRSYPSEYRWNGRIAISTGLPSVLGWNFHQKQQRTFAPLPRWVDQRDSNIRDFYNTDRIDQAVTILHHFDVKYIISSGLEQVQTSPEGLEKFNRMVDEGLLTVAYSIEGGTIYEVNKDAILHYLVERYQ